MSNVQGRRRRLLTNISGKLFLRVLIPYSLWPPAQPPSSTTTRVHCCCLQRMKTSFPISLSLYVSTTGLYPCVKLAISTALSLQSFFLSSCSSWLHLNEVMRYFLFLPATTTEMMMMTTTTTSTVYYNQLLLPTPFRPAIELHLHRGPSPLLICLR